MSDKKELRIQDQKNLSTYFVSALDSTINLPETVDKQRLALNFVSLIQDKPELLKYGADVMAPMVVRCAKDNLDVLNQEVYIYEGFGGKLTYTPSYRGLRKMAIEKSVKPINQIYSKLIKDGDEFEEEFSNGQQHIHFKAKFGNNGPIVGVFAVCVFADNTEIYEVMTKDEIDACKAKSRNSGAWKDFYGEMAKKSCVRRLCKNITLDFTDKQQADTFMGVDEFIEDPKEQAAKDVEENANQMDLNEEPVVEVTPDGQQTFIKE